MRTDLQTASGQSRAPQPCGGSAFFDLLCHRTRHRQSPVCAGYQHAVSGKKSEQYFYVYVYVYVYNAENRPEMHEIIVNA